MLRVIPGCTRRFWVITYFLARVMVLENPVQLVDYVSQINNSVHQDTKILLDVKKELEDATRIQPCPACKHDMEKFRIFLEAKIKSIQSASSTDGKTAKILKELSYINELSIIGIFLAKVLKPIITLGFFPVPPTYRNVLDKNRGANRIIREHLLSARSMLTKLEGIDEQYAAMSNILASFLKATEFKLDTDPQTFFIFDKLIRFLYKTHLLGFAGRAIVGTKTIMSCCMNK